MSTTVKYGLIAGVSIAVIQIALHYINLELSQDVSIASAIGIILPILFMVLGVKAERELQEGLISFGEALKTAFFVFMIASIISGVISFAHMQTWSDETWQRIGAIQMETAKGMMEMFGADELEIDDAMANEEFDIEMIKKTTASIGILLLGLLGSAIFGLVLSLIVAAIMKRNPTP